MKAVKIAWYNLIRMFRERANLFFVLIFPIAVIAALGSQFGGESTPEIGMSAETEYGQRTAERITETGAADIRWVDSSEQLPDLVDDGTVPVAAVVADDADDVLAAGGTPDVTILLGGDDQAAALAAVVERAFAAEAVVPGVAGQLAAETGMPIDEVAPVVEGVAGSLDPVEATRQVVGGAEPEEEPFGFAQIAVGMLMLMTFLNALTGAASVIESRSLGVSRRMVATPTSLRTIVVGEGMGRWGVGMFQAIYIMVATALIFGIEWGEPLAAVVVVALFAAVAAGAAMLIGATMHNAEQAAGITIMAGLALGALGGSMLPLDLFGSTMRTVAHVTPHAWAIDAFTQMVRHGAGLVDVLPQIGVLAAMAAVLIGLAAWRLRITLTKL